MDRRAVSRLFQPIDHLLRLDLDRLGPHIIEETPQGMPQLLMPLVLLFKIMIQTLIAPNSIHHDQLTDRNVFLGINTQVAPAAQLSAPLIIFNT